MAELDQDAVEGKRDAVVAIRDNGTISHDGLVIGSIGWLEEPALNGATLATPQIRLNLGWMKAAGIKLRVDGDPDVDHKRGGIVLER